MPILCRGLEMAVLSRTGRPCDMNHHELMLTQDSKTRLMLALSITASWFLVELAGGLYANSLALLADAAHMLTDLAALGLSLFALKISERPATHQKTYGYLRAEILAALANGVFLILIGIYIFYESYQRFMEPLKSRVLPCWQLRLRACLPTRPQALYHSRHENLNLAAHSPCSWRYPDQSAIIAGILMLTRQWYLADPIVSAIVGALCCTVHGNWWPRASTFF